MVYHLRSSWSWIGLPWSLITQGVHLTLQGEERYSKAELALQEAARLQVRDLLFRHLLFQVPPLLQYANQDWRKVWVTLRLVYSQLSWLERVHSGEQMLDLRINLLQIELYHFLS